MLTDREGTAVDVVQYNSGTNTTSVVDHLVYGSFGNITSQTNSTYQPLFGYTGQMWDAAASLYYYHARWFDPNTGRFISQDPTGFAAGDANLYRYVANDPANLVDPNGTTSLMVNPGQLNDALLLLGSPRPNPSSLNPLWTSPNSGASLMQVSSSPPRSDGGAMSGSSFAESDLANYGRVAAQMAAYAAQSAAAAAAVTNPGLMDDLKLMMNNPLATLHGAMVGYGHGQAMIANQLTFGLIGPLDNHVNDVIDANGGAYYHANIAAGIAVTAGTAALPCGHIANIFKAMNFASGALRAKDDVQNGNWASAALNLVGTAAVFKGNWCFVAGTPIVVGIEEIPVEARQNAIEVGPGHDVQRLSSVILVGVGLAGFVAMHPVPQISGLRRSRKTRSHLRRRSEFDKLFDDEYFYVLDDAGEPADDNQQRVRQDALLLPEIRNASPAEHNMNRGYVFEFTHRENKPFGAQATDAADHLKPPDVTTFAWENEVVATSGRGRELQNADQVGRAEGNESREIFGSQATAILSQPATTVRPTTNAEQPRTRNPRAGFRILSPARWTWLASCLVLAAWFGFGPSSVDDGHVAEFARIQSVVERCLSSGELSYQNCDSNSSSLLPPQQSAKSSQPKRGGIDLHRPRHHLITRPIETIQVGQRVLAENPELADGRVPETVIDPETTRLVVLHQVKPDGDELTVETLLPLEVLLPGVLERVNSEEELAVEPQPIGGLPEDVILHELLVGQVFELNLPELGAEGPAEIIAVRACPPLEANDGTSRRLVTSVFRHTAANVVDLSTTGSDDPIGTTDNHPFWSEDRQEFVPAGQLRIGERLRSASGALVAVKRITPRDGPRTAVFNFEVEGQHVYSVGSDGILVHNACKFGSAEFGNKVHGKFGKYLGDLTGKLPKYDRTARGLNGVDASYIKPVMVRDELGRFAGKMTHAELKPDSVSGWNRFFDQLGNWRANGVDGGVGLFLYDPQGKIRFFKIFH